MEELAPQSPAPPADDERRFAPMEQRERIRVIDVLRGFALFGILLVNMPLMNSPLALSMSKIEWWSSLLDRGVELGIRFLAQGKFISIFSFLFGLGLAIQFQRAEERGRSSARFFAKRMTWLLAFGLVHAFFIWYGDVLVTYAVLGFVLIAFRKRQDTTLRIWSVALLLLPIVMAAGLVGLVELGKLQPEARAEIEAQFIDATASIDAGIETARYAYAEGTLVELLLQRARDTMQIWSAALFFAPYVLAMFLLGMLTARLRILHNAGYHAPRIRRALPWLLGTGLAGNVVLVVASELAPHPALPSALGALAQAGFVLGGPTLAAAYAAIIVLLYQDDVWQARMAPLGAVGRMALTNYIMQSLICVALFNSHGLGWYGQVPPWAGLLLTIAIYALQIAVSRWWLERFRFGPLEWIWRSLTYARRQPFRREA